MHARTYAGGSGCSWRCSILWCLYWLLAQTKDRGDMTYEERLSAAEQYRLRGNALFQEARPGPPMTCIA